MLRFFLTLIALYAQPVSAAAIETKYFSLDLPESLSQVEGDKTPERGEAKIAAMAGEKQFLIIEYANKEKWPPVDSGFQRAIKEANKESEIKNGPKHYFEGKKLEVQECEVNCSAYYREATLKDGETSVSLYQYFVEGKNTWVFMGYVDAVNDRAVSQKMMQDFIQQIKARGL
jgi:hypothetical protein